jgi:hypothetical protein
MYYVIQVRENDKEWVIRRRYRDFEKLTEHACGRLALPLKGSKLGIRRKFNLAGFSETLCEGLQSLLALHISAVLSLKESAVLQSFLSEPVLADAPSPRKHLSAEGTLLNAPIFFASPGMQISTDWEKQQMEMDVSRLSSKVSARDRKVEQVAEQEAEGNKHAQECELAAQRSPRHFAYSGMQISSDWEKQQMEMDVSRLPSKATARDRKEEQSAEQEAEGNKHPQERELAAQRSPRLFTYPGMQISSDWEKQLMEIDVSRLSSKASSHDWKEEQVAQQEPEGNTHQQERELAAQRSPRFVAYPGMQISTDWEKQQMEMDVSRKRCHAASKSDP